MASMSASVCKASAYVESGLLNECNKINLMGRNLDGTIDARSNFSHDPLACERRGDTIFMSSTNLFRDLTHDGRL